MKNLYLNRVFLLSAFLSFLQMSFSQCPGGWSGTATLKWDNRNYLVTTGNYAGFVTAAMSTSQNFSLGKNRVNIAFAGITTTAQNTVNTGNTNSFGSGAAVQYNGNGTITLTFDTVVANLQFSLYDIDLQQTAKVTAKDASGTSYSVSITVNLDTLKPTAPVITGPALTNAAPAWKWASGSGGSGDFRYKWGDNNFASGSVPTRGLGLHLGGPNGFRDHLYLACGGTGPGGELVRSLRPGH